MKGAHPKNNYLMISPMFLLQVFWPKWKALTWSLGSSATRIMMKSVDIKLITPCAEWWFILGCWNAAANHCVPRRQCHIIHQACRWGIFCLSNSLSLKQAHARKSQPPPDSWCNISFFSRWVKRTKVFRMQHKWMNSNSHGGREIGRKNSLYVPSLVPHFWNPPPSGHEARMKEKQRLGFIGEVTIAGIERAPLLAATVSPEIGHSIFDHWAPWGPPSSRTLAIDVYWKSDHSWAHGEALYLYSQN